MNQFLSSVWSICNLCVSFFPAHPCIVPTFSYLDSPPGVVLGLPPCRSPDLPPGACSSPDLLHQVLGATASSLDLLGSELAPEVLAVVFTIYVKTMTCSLKLIQNHRLAGHPVLGFLNHFTFVKKINVQYSFLIPMFS